MGDELTTVADKIKKIEEKVEKLEQHINTITTGEDAAVEALVKKLRFRHGDEALDSLRADKSVLQSEKAALQSEKVELLKKENLLLQQQQSGAGTSMLPVLQEFVVFPCQISRCIHQQVLQLSEVRVCCVGVLHSYGLVLLHTCAAYLHALEKRMHCSSAQVRISPAADALCHASYDVQSCMHQVSYLALLCAVPHYSILFFEINRL
jgi:hypothetical protein